VCAKGSAHLRPYQVTSDYYLLWPYDSDNKLLAVGALATKYPMAWKYLKQCESLLRGREGGKKFDDNRWWRFGRDQGRDASGSAKLLMPATMNKGMVSYDEKGQVSFTASGKGGGGAYALMPKPMRRCIRDGCLPS
jgi:adenine-specific DNA-methyltransferase